MLDSFLIIATHPLLWIFIGLTVVFYGVQGLVGQSAEAPTAPDDRIRRLAETVGMKGLHPVLFLILVLTWGIVAGTLFAGLYAILWQVIFHAPPEGAEDVWNWRFTLAQLVTLTTVLGAVIALPITINRLILTRRQTDTVEQGHITDRINKAVEGLGAEKTVRLHRKDSNGNFLFHEKEGSQGNTKAELDYKRPVIVELTESNLEVRIGAIYALERISQDSARDHIQIMEILCVYIRQNARREDVPLPEGELTPEEWRVWAEEGREHPRLDVDVALKVIERRGEDRKRLENDTEYRLGLERAPLRKVILSQRDLTGADLREAGLQGAQLRLAQLQGANLAFTQLQGADLRGAQLQGASLEFAQLQGARLWHAQLQGAELGYAELQGANLWHGQLQGVNLADAKLQEAHLGYAELKGANLWRAQLQGANLSGAQLQGAYLREVAFDDKTALSRAHIRGIANLRGAAAREVDFTYTLQFSDHLQGMFGDGSVILPGGQGPKHERWPQHWPKFKLGDDQFHEEWRKWQADQENYVPPEAPEEG